MSLTQDEKAERNGLMSSGHTARTSERLHQLNIKLNKSKPDAQVLREIKERAAVGKPIGQLVADARRRGLKF